MPPLRRAVRIAGLIFAGGKSSRFAGGLKEDALLDGRTLLSHVIERSAPQVDILAISRASGSAAPVPGVAIVADIIPDRGPLGGLHAGLVWAKTLAPPADYLATFACDMPLLLRDLVARLQEEMRRSGAKAVIAATGDDRHPTLGLWSTALLPVAETRLELGANSLIGFAENAGARLVQFDDPSGAAFFNVNTRKDLAALQAIVAKTPAS